MDMKIKDLMTPVEEYVRIGRGATLAECFRALGEAEAASGQGGPRAHHDALVVDDDGAVVGTVTMLDIFLALEPAYKDITAAPSDKAVLTPEYLTRIYKDFDLWANPLPSLCRRTAGLIVGEIMHDPADAEFVHETDPLDLALHRYVMGVHQPLLVRDADGDVRGVLRLTDVYATIKDLALACPV